MAGQAQADALIAALGLAPHPEGGHYREIYRDQAPDGGRGAVTEMYYLLKAGEHSHWHRIDAIEIWHYCAGDTLELRISGDGESVLAHRLGQHVEGHENPVVVVPAYAWQGALPLGAYCLVGRTVAPAFSFAGFELAPPSWQPAKG
ncbi:MAG TPA: cupin domain-containing protein [Alphaproteobacteria bacterium]|nr:cupin domain-containing protein [Alphaproteobacteria bacterium]